MAAGCLGRLTMNPKGQIAQSGERGARDGGARNHTDQRGISRLSG